MSPGTPGTSFPEITDIPQDNVRDAPKDIQPDAASEQVQDDTPQVQDIPPLQAETTFFEEHPSEDPVQELHLDPIQVPEEADAKPSFAVHLPEEQLDEPEEKTFVQPQEAQEVTPEIEQEVLQDIPPIQDIPVQEPSQEVTEEVTTEEPHEEESQAEEPEEPLEETLEETPEEAPEEVLPVPETTELPQEEQQENTLVQKF